MIILPVQAAGAGDRVLGCIRSCRAPPALCSSFSLSACRAHCDDDDDDDDDDDGG